MLRNPVIIPKHKAAIAAYLLTAAGSLAMCLIAVRAVLQSHNAAISINADLAKSQAASPIAPTPEQQAAITSIKKSAWNLERQSAVQLAVWGGMFAVSMFPVVRLFIQNRHGPGLCAKCGYNLTGNTSGDCPECGTALNP